MLRWRKQVPVRYLFVAVSPLRGCGGDSGTFVVVINSKKCGRAVPGFPERKIQSKGNAT